MKICYKCKIEKELIEFNKDSQKKDGVNSNCKECARKSNHISNKKYKQNNKEKLKHQKTKWNCKAIYNITFEEYQYRMSTSTYCEICSSTQDLCYDHDHNTLEFRGVLCRRCNRSIGQLGDTREDIIKVLNYFDK